jgi:hypothetical protein
MMQKNNPKAAKYRLQNFLLVLKYWISRRRAQMAVRAIRIQAHKNGLDTMTEQEIDTLIKETRADRKH